MSCDTDYTEYGPRIFRRRRLPYVYNEFETGGLIKLMKDKSCSNPHFAIYIGNYTIVYLDCMMEDSPCHGEYSVKKGNFLDPSFPFVPWTEKYDTKSRKDLINPPKSTEWIVARAQGHVGTSWKSSCEHFVDFCRYGVSTDYEVYEHNKAKLEELIIGDLVDFKRRKVVRYDHWAIYVGSGCVIHLVLPGLNMEHSLSAFGRTAVVAKDSFWDAAGDSKANKNNKLDEQLKQYPREEIVQRAVSRQGRIPYNILWKNCEHFAKFCRYGVERSDQLRHVLLSPLHLLVNWIFWLFRVFGAIWRVLLYPLHLLVNWIFWLFLVFGAIWRGDDEALS